MREEHRVGIQCLHEVTCLMQRVRAAHPPAAQFEAADFQWWWRIPRTTDVLPQLFWFDESHRPEPAVIATDWGDAIGFDAIYMPDATPDWIAHVVQRGLAHANDSGLDKVGFVIDRADVLGAVRNTAKGIVSGAGEVGVDIADATTGALTGALEGAKKIGLSAEDLVSAAAEGALEAAEGIGETAVHAVRDVAASGVGGVKAVVKGEQDS